MPGLSVLRPFTLSEPLLTDLEELVPFLAEHGPELEVVTNAALLTPGRLEVILPHLHRVSFSIDSHLPEIYESIRVGTSFEVVDRNVKAAVPRLREAGVLVRINMVLTNVGLPHLEDFADYVVDEYGIRHIDVFELVPYTELGKELDPFVDPGPEATEHALQRLLDKGEERDVRLDLLVREPYAASRGSGVERDRNSVASRFENEMVEVRREFPWICDQIMTYLKVQPDGAAFPCCVSPVEFHLGNAFTQDLDSIWNSRTARRLRRRFYERDYPKTCKECLFLAYARSTSNQIPVPLSMRAVYAVRRVARRIDEHVVDPVRNVGGSWLARGCRFLGNAGSGLHAWWGSRMRTWWSHRRNDLEIVTSRGSMACRWFTHWWGSRLRTWWSHRKNDLEVVTSRGRSARKRIARALHLPRILS